MNSIVPADHIILKPLDKQNHYASRHQGYEMHAMERRTGREHGHRENESGESAHPCVEKHHFAIGQYVRAADVQSKARSSPPGSMSLRDSAKSCSLADFSIRRVRKSAPIAVFSFAILDAWFG